MLTREVASTLVCLAHEQVGSLPVWGKPGGFFGPGGTAVGVVEGTA
ncbi:MAG: hypothetical protein H0U76_11005, partial [Ktedonobacteraceae bacterium]|nr:hypothetical protein [Ktedonobacteraceae bacterium]